MGTHPHERQWLTDGPLVNFTAILKQNVKADRMTPPTCEKVVLIYKGLNDGMAPKFSPSLPLMKGKFCLLPSLRKGGKNRASANIHQSSVTERGDENKKRENGDQTT